MALIDLKQIKGGVDLQSGLDQAKSDITRVENTVIPGKVSELESKIGAKADASAVYNKATIDEKLGAKADKTALDAKADKEAVNTALEAKADKETVNTALETKADKATVESALQTKANTADVEEKLGQKADQSALTEGLSGKADKGHRHNNGEIDGLGSAAVKNVGTGNGQIPVLNEQGKLNPSVLPAVAVNEFHTVVSTEAAMELDVQNGDIVYIDESSSEPEELLRGMLLAETVGATYICVKHDAETFEEKFRPLSATGDSVSKGELTQLLNAKADKSQVATDIQGAKDHATSVATEKANAVDSKLTQAKTDLDGKITGVSGKVEELTRTVETNKQNATQEIARVEGLVGGNTTSISNLSGRVDGHDTKIGQLEEAIRGIVVVESVEKFTATDAQTEFTVEGSISNPATVKVYVNGIKAAKGDFEVLEQVVTWKPEDAGYAIGEGFIVEVTYM